MRTILITAAALLITYLSFAQLPPGASYPESRTEEVSDVHFGVEVKDPYRWLEDLDSEEVTAWVDAQNVITEQYAGKYLKSRKTLKDLYTRRDYWSEKEYYYSVIESGGLYFFLKEGAGKQIVSYHEDYNKLESAQVLFSTAVFRTYESEFVTVGDISVDSSGRYAAFSMERSGADLGTIHLLDLETREFVKEIKNVKFSRVIWNSTGFYYSRFEGEDLFDVSAEYEICFHELGAEKEDLVLRKQIATTSYTDGFGLATGDRNLVIYGEEKIKGRSFFTAYAIPLSRNVAEPKPFLVMPVRDGMDFSIKHIKGDTILVQTNINAPNNTAMLYSMSGTNQAEVLIPEFAERLVDIARLENFVLAVYLVGGVPQGYLFNMKGENLNQIAFPEGYSVDGVAASHEDSVFIYKVNSFFKYPSVFQFDPWTKETDLYGSSMGTIALESQSTTELVEFTSKDGTTIPMYISHLKSHKKNGDTPVLLYGYGGFGVTLTPFYSPMHRFWLDRGGILAVPCIRGGGEFGKSWHDAGKRLNKQNSFDDFIAAAQYLVDEGYTRPERIGILGGSNGGLLVAAVLTQRPDLFGAAVPRVAATDMLRYQHWAHGGAVVQEYGVSSDSLDFFNLKEYSPLHNVAKGVEYPPTLIVTGDHDDRVPPCHSYKFAAAMQAEKSSSDNPVLLYVGEESGHSGSDNVLRSVKSETLVLSFFMKHLGMDLFKVKKLD